MTPIEAAAQEHPDFHGDDGFMGKDRARRDARAIITAFLESAAEDEDTFFRVKFALLDNGATGSTPQAKAAILALKEAVNG